MNVLKPWMEMDLTASASKLPKAVLVDQPLQMLREAIQANRLPILVGDAGVGKTAVVHELVRGLRAGEGPARLARRHVIEISIRKRVSSLQNPYQVFEELQKLSEALRKMRRAPVLLISDLGVAYDLDLEDRIAAFAYDVPIIGECVPATGAALLESSPALRSEATLVRVDEPSLSRTRDIVRASLEANEVQHRFGDDAIEQALALSHRFLVRQHQPRKTLELLRGAAASVREKRVVCSRDIVERAASQFAIPRMLIDPEQPLDLPALRKRFDSAVIGQPDAVRAVVDTIGVLKAGLSDVRRPLAALLLAGTTGVGKTLIAQLLAETLFGRRDRLIRVNMADHAGGDDATELFGSPGRAGHPGNPGVLAQRLAGQAMGVHLLDEFEKAHTSVHDRFLQLIDEGEFVSGTGETISCRAMVIIATSNAGYSRSESESFGFANGSQSIGEDGLVRLERHFRYELINRFDRVITFRRMSREDAHRIALLELRELQRRIGLRQRGLCLDIEGRALSWLVDHGYSPERGARFMRRAVEQYATTEIAAAVLASRPSPGSRLRIRLRGDRLGVDVLAPGSTKIGRQRPPEKRVAPVRSRSVRRTERRATRILGRPDTAAVQR